MRKRLILGASFGCLILAILGLLWFERAPTPEIEACDSCDIRHQRLKPKALDAQ